MTDNGRGKTGWCLLAIGLAAGAAGVWWQDWLLCAAALPALALAVKPRRGALSSGPRWPAWPETPQRPADEEPAVAIDADGPEDEMSVLIGDMLRHGRYGLLLRPAIASTLSEPQTRRARNLLEEAMSLVPEGHVVLGHPAGQFVDAADRARTLPEHRTVWVEAVFIDRHPVTNRQFKQFVDEGGYDQMEIWDTEIWPAVLDFVDKGGATGPRFWTDGDYPPGLDDHPVVGVSWHEAAAYARWVGKRLPTDAEWTKAGSWPVPVAGNKLSQRKYPWGKSMDRTRANLWGAGRNETAPVGRFEGGASVGGVSGLIGNVWEWTASSFSITVPGTSAGAYGALVLPVPMKSVRGGAFDTYFDSQATCHFASGDEPLARKHNIGFRCALGVCDVAGLCMADEDDEDAQADAALTGEADGETTPRQ